MIHWANDYLGKPWVANTFGPDSFDCWGLLCAIYKARLGLELPRYDGVVRGDFRAMAGTADNAIADLWIPLKKPVELCAVGLANAPSRVHHVGIYLDLDGGMIMHCQKRSGCIVEPLLSIRRNWQHISYYALNTDLR